MSWRTDAVPPPSLLQVATFDECVLMAPAGLQAAIAALRAAASQHMRLNCREQDILVRPHSILVSFTLESCLA